MGVGGSFLNLSPPSEKSSMHHRGHRRLASFDPNTDCFSHFNYLAGGGSDGGGALAEAGRRFVMDVDERLCCILVTTLGRDRIYIFFSLLIGLFRDRGACIDVGWSPLSVCGVEAPGGVHRSKGRAG